MITRNFRNMKIVFLIVSVVMFPVVSTARNGAATPGYNNKIPESIMTPNKVETRIGTLEFFDGIPNPKAAALAFYFHKCK